MKDLHGKNAIVTGSSRGLGVCIAEALAREGANLALVARTTDDLETVANELRKFGTRILTVPADITLERDRISLLKYAETELGQIDVLVNNAAIAQWIPFHEEESEDIVSAIETNLKAPMLLTRVVLPAMIKRGYGHIVNIASVPGKRGIPYEATYSATKAGLVEWTNALWMELEGTGVGVSVLCPIFVSGVGGFARQGLPPPWLIGAVPPEYVAKKVIQSIKMNSQELIVWRRPVRLLLALNALSPSIGNLIIKLLGGSKFNRQLAGGDGRMPAASWRNRQS